MSAPFIGNPDYRGYLNYLSKQNNGGISQKAATLLNLVGNDAKFGAGAGVVSPALISLNNDFYKNFQGLSAPAPSYNAGANILGGGGGNYAVKAPVWNLTDIYNQQGSQAAANVNPYYNTKMQQFQQQQALQDQQRQLNLQNLGDQLTNQLQSNETSRGRTSQDVLQNEQQIGIAADQRQQDQGQQFDQARLAQAKQLAGEGLTTSGLGSQQALQSETARNVQEQRQGAQDQQQVVAQELTKARTFEDLANSDVLAKHAKEQGEKGVQIDWDKFINGQESAKQDLKKQQLADIASEQRRLAQQRLNQMIDAISNPAQKIAASQAYGGRF